MLRTRRAGDETDTRMLTAMLDATGRITTLARQASELAMWKDARTVREGPRELRVHQLVERTAKAASVPAGVSVSVSDVGDESVSSHGDAALVAALAAILGVLARDLPDQPLALLSRRASDGRVEIVLGPDSMLVTPAADVPVEMTNLTETDFSFDRGGQGLALILAGYVLETHDACVRSLPGANGAMVVSLPVVSLPEERGRS